MEAVFCVDYLEEALRNHGKPEIFNSDQGAQFTNEVFTGVLIQKDIVISMDGRGRAFDNIFVERLWRSVKHEDVYMKGYSTMSELTGGLSEYFTFYNGERPHQSLAQKTPDLVYRTAIGGGALIVDKYPLVAMVVDSPVERSGTGESTTETKSEATKKPKSGQRLSAVNEFECAA